MNEPITLRQFDAGDAAPAVPAAEPAAAPVPTAEPSPAAEPSGPAAPSPADPPAEAAPGSLLDAAADSLSERLVARQVREISERWQAESDAIREVYPMFALETELQSPEFRALVKAGVTLRRAYETVHLPEILGACMRFAAEAGMKNAAASPPRVRENAVLDRAASIPHTNVRDLTERDILRILDSVGKGAKIRF